MATVLTIIFILFVIVTLLGFSRHVWWFTILDFPRLQYAVVSIAIAILTAYFQFWILSGGFFLIALINLYRIRHFLPGMKRQKSFKNKTIMSVNAFRENTDYKDFNDTVIKADPEILLIMEMTDHLWNHIQPCVKSYPYKLEVPVRDGFRICLLSKSKLRDTEITHHGPGKTPLLHAKVKLNGREFQVFSAHPKPALNKNWYEERGHYFHEIEKIVQSADLPVIVLGDFNSVPWEKHFQVFLKNTNLKSTLCNHGYKITWPVYFPLMGVPMDHILISVDEPFSDLYVGHYIGSDHYPVFCDL